jgi:hypothetical protein
MRCRYGWRRWPICWVTAMMALGAVFARAEATKEEADGWRRWVPPAVADLVDEAGEKIKEMAGSLSPVAELEEFRMDDS